MYQLRPIQPQDNAALADIIRQVSKEFGLAPESGFAVADPSVDALYEIYQQAESQYWVIEKVETGQILGGGGISPLTGDAYLLEIQKMYFLPEIRGLGFAKQILKNCFNIAEQHSKSCYLETTTQLNQAVHLYEKMGFQYLTAPRGQTGHSYACEIWMLKA